MIGHQRRAAGQFRQQLPARGLQLADVSQVNERGKDPGVDSARTPSKTCTIAPCRSTSLSSMLSAPGAIPATRQARLQVRKPSDRAPKSRSFVRVRPLHLDLRGLVCSLSGGRREEG